MMFSSLTARLLHRESEKDLYPSGEPSRLDALEGGAPGFARLASRPATLVAIFAERTLPDPREKLLLARGRLPVGGMLEALMRFMRPDVLTQAYAARLFSHVGQAAGRFEAVRPLLLAYGAQNGEDYSDALRYSVTNHGFRHQHLGMGTIAVVTDREALPAGMSKRWVTEDNADDVLEALLAGESGEADAVWPDGSPVAPEGGGGTCPPRTLAHVLVFAEGTVEDALERVFLRERQAMLPGGQIEEVLREELRFPFSDGCPVTVHAPMRGRDWRIENIQLAVTETGERIGRTYSDRTAFEVRSRAFDSAALGRLLVVSALRRPKAPAAADPVLIPVDGKEEAGADTTDVESAASPEDIIAEEPEAAEESAPVQGDIEQERYAVGTAESEEEESAVAEGLSPREDADVEAATEAELWWQDEDDVFVEDAAIAEQIGLELQILQQEFIEEEIQPAAQRLFTLKEAALFMNQHPIDGGEMACVRGNRRPLPGGVIERVIRTHLAGELGPEVAVQIWWSLGPAASAEAAVRAILVADGAARNLDFADPSQCQLRIERVEDTACGSGSIVFVKMAHPPE